MIDRPAPAGSGEELALSLVGGVHFPPSPNLTNEEQATTARGNRYPPTRERRDTMEQDQPARLRSVCPDCGDVFDREDSFSRCPECKPRRTSRPNHEWRGSSTARGYDYRWRKLSERARRLSPQCEDCGAVDDLTTDHSAEAWRRREAGLSIRLRDVAVVCARCNAERGAARGSRADGHERWERPDMAQLADDLDRDDD